ncbi:DUF481 domain-containing protein [Tamlana sp. I1]|uniref:DUF481 domain-containing protein n=1 Tax=Tamlana sp. I1 TaxID=2762061 RepID=UPI00188F88EC|nr:DUF481 domain-containing protein [Tamlana sp. I1]
MLSLSLIGFSQVDTLKLKDKTVLTGEVKKLKQNVITIETDYSDSDFNVKFEDVKYIYLKRKSLVVLTKNRREFGQLTTNKDGLGQVILEDGKVVEFSLSEIVALNEINEDFINRFSGAIDLGYNLSKANNSQQFSVSGEIHYLDRSWIADGTVSVLNTTQDDAERTKRTDAKVDIFRILANRQWYLLANASFLSNTEQALKGRITPSIGAGKFIKNNTKLYWGLSAGINYNIENYVDTSLNKTSSEIFVATNLNLFNYDDISVTANLTVLPSLSEKGRLRTDFDTSLKYDLPSDFYIKAGFTLNYDNQPAIEGNDTDYIITTGLGWKFN